MDVYVASENCCRLHDVKNIPVELLAIYRQYHLNMLARLLVIPDIQSHIGHGYHALVDVEDIFVYCPEADFIPSEDGFIHTAGLSKGHLVAKYGFNESSLPLKGVEGRILVDIQSYWLEMENNAKQQLMHLGVAVSSYFGEK